MKRALLLVFIFCALVCAANAQQVRASPMEGRWVWDGVGEDPDFIEMVFFGNVILAMEEPYPIYGGLSFTYTDRSITLGTLFEWQYSISGNTLTITDMFDDVFSYTRTPMQRSPLEGIWRQTGGDDYDPEEEMYFLFTCDIMALGDGYEYVGLKVDFYGRTFHPSRRMFENNPEVLPQEYLDEYITSATMEYSLAGRLLTISHQGEVMVLTKIY